MGFSRMRQTQDTNTQPTAKSMHQEKATSRERPMTCRTPSASVAVVRYCTNVPAVPCHLKRLSPRSMASNFMRPIWGACEMEGAMGSGNM
jgi:hypothetical protein